VIVTAFPVIVTPVADNSPEKEEYMKLALALAALIAVGCAGNDPRIVYMKFESKPDAVRRAEEDKAMEARRLAKKEEARLAEQERAEAAERLFEAERTAELRRLAEDQNVKEVEKITFDDECFVDNYAEKCMRIRLPLMALSSTRFTGKPVVLRAIDPKERTKLDWVLVVSAKAEGTDELGRIRQFRCIMYFHKLDWQWDFSRLEIMRY
jgi:hypothetical protein